MTLIAPEKASKIHLFSFRPPHMRAFHFTWTAFFLCFLGWFGIAPLMAIVRQDLRLTSEQVGNTIIASVVITIFARLLIGRLCDRIGPRITYTALLIGGSLPVMFIGLSNSYESFLLFRLAIGIVGASFVITQSHTSLMFAPNVVGTANATTAGWGNLGGGIAQMVMPLLFTALTALGFTSSSAWRWAMVAPGAALFVMGLLYYRFTQDTPVGNFRARGQASPAAKKDRVPFGKVLRDYRVWALFLVYGACFGVELTINNIAAIYFTDYFRLDIRTAGIIAGLFGLMNIFARSLGGFFGDRFGMRSGLRGRVHFLFAVLLAEGLSLLLFSRMSLLPAAVASMIMFSLFVQMSEGATFSVVPFINKNAMGSVSGIVGAGGNAGAVAAGFLFRSEAISLPGALFIMGLCVTVISFSALAVRFPAREGKPGEEPAKGTGANAPGGARLEPVLLPQSNECKTRHI